MNFLLRNLDRNRLSTLGALAAIALAVLLHLGFASGPEAALAAQEPAAGESVRGETTHVLGQWRLEYEQRLGRAIEELLEPLVGAGKARAEVSAELDLERLTINSEIVDPDSQVPRTVRTIDEGARSDVTTNYDFSRTVKNLAREPGQIKRLSIAVLVDGTYEGGTYTPRTASEIEQLTRLVHSAVGFDAARGDKLEFVNLRFSDLPPRGSRPALLLGLTRGELLRLGELAILCLAGLLALLLLLRVIGTRRMTPAVATASPSSAPAPIIIERPPAPEPAKAIEPAVPKRSLWDKLGEVNESALANYLRNEYPQTVALVLSRIDAAHAARVLPALPEPFAADVVARMLRLEPVQQQVLDEVERTMAAEFATTLARAPMADAHETVARIMDKLDRATEQRLIGALENQNREGAERVKSRMLSFEDLARLDPGDARRLLRAAPADRLAIALKGASEKMRALFVAGLPERSARILREEIAALGPVKLSDVDEAQAVIVAMARDLAARGEIDLQGRK